MEKYVKKYKEQVILAGILLCASIILYIINYIIFRDLHHIFIFLTEDIAFIPIEILIVTLIIDKILERREREKLLEKLNMVIGVFFIEIGNDLLKIFANADPDVESIRTTCIINNCWVEEDYKTITQIVTNHKHEIDIEKMNIAGMKQLLFSERDFFIRLLQNPSLLEHETFTELLQSLFHIQDEFLHRERIRKLTKEDYKHLKKDIERGYSLLAYEWIIYMQYLQNNYPYLFVSALINNPYDNRSYEEIEKDVYALNLTGNRGY